MRGPTCAAPTVTVLFGVWCFGDADAAAAALALCTCTCMGRATRCFGGAEVDDLAETLDVCGTTQGGDQPGERSGRGGSGGRLGVDEVRPINNSRNEAEVVIVLDDGCIKQH